MNKAIFLSLFLLGFISCSKDENPVARNENYSPEAKFKDGMIDSPTRGIWWWQDPESSYGTTHVIGNQNLENFAVLQFKTMRIDKVYGSYNGNLFTNSQVLKNWNSKLYNQKIKSSLLLGENTWIYPEIRPQLIEIVTNNVVNFNKSCQMRSEIFTSLHLDIEPQALPSWNFPKRRRGLVQYLLETYKDVRSELDKNGQAGVLLYADLPDWIDNFETNNSVGWRSAADRDQWYTDLSAILDGITLMAYEKQISSVINTTSYERTHCSIPVEIGLNFSDSIWLNNYSYFMQNVSALENNTHCKVVIHSYSSIAPSNPIDSK